MGKLSDCYDVLERAVLFEIEKKLAAKKEPLIRNSKSVLKVINSAHKNFTIDGRLITHISIGLVLTEDGYEYQHTVLPLDELIDLVENYLD